jgi:cytochrome c-type biogenesis protein
MDLNELLSGTTIPIVSAFILGLITAISPCPLATNIAAIAYINRKIGDRKYAVITGSLYTLGRMVSYTFIGILILMIGVEIPGIALFLQTTGEMIVGPLLIVIGILMLVIDKIPAAGGGGKLATLGNKVADKGMLGGFLLGIIFALAFCPYSAVLYFGMLMPLSLKSAEGMALPPIYAIGTGLPVLVFGTLVALGIAGISSWVNALTKVERIIRIIVAVIFIGVGIYSIFQLL